MSEHRDLPEDQVHVAGYVDTVDPGAVGAGKLWIDTSGTTPTIKKRNAGDTDWDDLGVIPEAIVSGTLDSDVTIGSGGTVIAGGITLGPAGMEMKGDGTASPSNVTLKDHLGATKGLLYVDDSGVTRVIFATTSQFYISSTSILHLAADTQASL